MFFLLREIGINGKLLSMEKVMYSETKAAIRINDKITEWFKQRPKSVKSKMTHPQFCYLWVF